jgi:hypothetical protein
MTMEMISVGDKVRIYLDTKFGSNEGWYEGQVVKIDPYSAYRSFYWVRLDVEAQAALGGRLELISVFNPKNIVKL